MGRLRFLVSILIVGLVGALTSGADLSVVAQEAIPTELAGHPVVGAWVFDTDAADPANALSYAAFHADGTYVAWSIGHASYPGSEPLTLLLPL